MMVSWLLWFLWMIFVVGDVDDFVVCLLGGGVWMINIGLPMSNLYICEFNLGHNKKMQTHGKNLALILRL